MNRRSLMIAAVCGAAMALPAVAANESILAEPESVDRTQPFAFAPEMLGSGVLMLVTDDDSQQIEIRVGPEAGVVQVIGVDGVPDEEFTGITTIDLLTGGGQDYVEFRIYGPVVPDIYVNTGSNNSDVKFIYQIPYTTDVVDTMVEVTGGLKNDKVAFEVLNSVETFIADWGVVHFNGDNETKVTIDTPEATTLTAINLSTVSGSGKDKLSAQFKSGAEDVDLDVYASLGSGNDSSILTVDEQAPGFTRLAVAINLGKGLDVAETITVLRGGTSTQTGAITGGGGDDFLKLLQEGPGSNNIVLNSGAGDDYLDMEFKGSITGSPKQRAGADDDFLKLVATNPGLLNPLLDGGPGFDVAHGFGTIINVEDFD